MTINIVNSQFPPLTVTTSVFILICCLLPFNVPLIWSEPGAAPQNVQGRSTSSTEISVQWDEVPKDKQHGEILHYTVIYRKTEGGEQKTSRVNSRNVKLTGLTEYTSYSISVIAATVKGDGPASSAITVRTDEDSKFLQGYFLNWFYYILRTQVLFECNSHVTNILLRKKG